MKSAKKTVLVTGASRGIGLELTKHLVKIGYRVIGVARNVSILLEIGASPLAKGGCEPSLECIMVDATDEVSVQQVVEKISAGNGRLDCLINNVGGIPKPGPFNDLSAKDWEDCFRLNVISMVNFSKLCFPLLKEANIGKVINMTSATAAEPGAFNPHYSAAKAAVSNLTKYLANSWAKEKILVNSIAAGPLDSPSLREVIAITAEEQGRDLKIVEREFLSNLEQKIPLGVLGTIDDVVDLTAFLLSDSANWITGSNFRLDGGRQHGIF